MATTQKVTDLAQLKTVLNRVATELVDKDITIAGVDLNDSITVAELLTALGVESGANKTTVDSILSTTSTNPVQNAVITTAVTALQGDIETLESDALTVVISADEPTATNAIWFKTAS